MLIVLSHLSWLPVIPVRIDCCSSAFLIVGNDLVHVATHFTNVIAKSIIVVLLALVDLLYPVVVPINIDCIDSILAFFAELFNDLLSLGLGDIGRSLPILIPEVAIHISRASSCNR